MIKAKRQATSKTVRPKVLVAMSGGVDSSVAAAMLKREGYDVTGGFIKNWSSSRDPMSGECAWRTERRDALRVAAALDIPLLTFDFEKQYRELVVAELYRGYEAGITPNPDVLCNEYVKFGLFWDKAKELGFQAMATGHYARVKREAKACPAKLLRGLDPDKDQSYFLYRVGQEALAHTHFPIGGLRKAKVRDLARRWNVPVAEKPDSQGICFIGKIKLGDFLSSKVKSKPGDIVTSDGRTIGRHQGLHLYTIGQRQRIAVADKHPWFVAQKDLKNNRLVVVEREDHPWLSAKTIELDDLHWIAGIKATDGTVHVQARYRQKPSRARLSIASHGKTATLDLGQPIQSAALGQSAVLYRGQECLGGGVIRRIEHSC